MFILFLLQFLVALSLSGCMGINLRAWKNQAPYFRSGEVYDPKWHRIVQTMMNHPNFLPKRQGRSPILFRPFTGFNPENFDLATQVSKSEDMPLDLDTNDYESKETQSFRDKKRNDPKKDGKDAKGDFDSNSYFMLRPLRRESIDDYETPITSTILGKNRNESRNWN